MVVGRLQPSVAMSMMSMSMCTTDDWQRRRSRRRRERECPSVRSVSPQEGNSLDTGGTRLLKALRLSSADCILCTMCSRCARRRPNLTLSTPLPDG